MVRRVGYSIVSRGQELMKPTQMMRTKIVPLLRRQLNHINNLPSRNYSDDAVYQWVIITLKLI
jgi:hypothetical protein